MEQKEFLDHCWAIFANPKIQGTKNYWTKKFLALVQKTIDNNSIAHPFDFAVREDTFTYASTDSDGTVTLSGLNFDARSIVRVRRGSDGFPMTEITRQARRTTFGQVVFSSVTHWFKKPRASDGVPVIQILATPSVGDTFEYEYHRTGISLAEWPSEFADVLAYGVLKKIDGSYLLKHRDSLRTMIAFYDELPEDADTMPLTDELLNVATQVNSMSR